MRGLHLVVHLIGCLHDNLNIKVLCSHGQQLVIIIPDIPGVACDALKLLERGSLLGFAWRGWRRLVASFNQAARQIQGNEKREDKGQRIRLKKLREKV